VKPTDTGGSDLLTLFISDWIAKENTFFDVALHLPDVAWMGLGDIDDIEYRTVFVLPIQLAERGNLPAKWRSSVTTKNEDDRLRVAKRGKRHGTGTIKERKREVRSGVINVKASGSRTFPHRFEWKQQERRRPDMHHHPGERFRRLMHRVIEAREHCTIEHQDGHSDLHKTSFPALAVLCGASIRRYGRWGWWRAHAYYEKALTLEYTAF